MCPVSWQVGDGGVSHRLWDHGGCGIEPVQQVATQPSADGQNARKPFYIISTNHTDGSDGDEELLIRPELLIQESVDGGISALRPHHGPDACRP